MNRSLRGLGWKKRNLNMCRLLKNKSYIQIASTSSTNKNLREKYISYLFKEKERVSMEQFDICKMLRGIENSIVDEINPHSPVAFKSLSLFVSLLGSPHSKNAHVIVLNAFRKASNSINWIHDVVVYCDLIKCKNFEHRNFKNHDEVLDAILEQLSGLDRDLCPSKDEFSDWLRNNFVKV